MSQIKRKTILSSGALTVIGLMLPGSASALDMEFVTYNGFDTIVQAFQRISLIFSDANFLSLFLSVAVLGILFGGIALYVRGLTGQPVNIMSWLLPIILGGAIFQALIIPKGNVIISDTVRNQFQIVGGVPDAIVAISGLLNLIERSVVDVVDLASAYPYADEAGGITFDLIYRATGEMLDIDDYFLTKSIGQYFLDCSPIALNTAAFPVDTNQLKRGTNDMQAMLAAMASTTDFTTVYNAGNKAGVTRTCNDAWALDINPVLGNAATFANAESTLCHKIGFDPTSVQALNSCRNLMDRAMEEYGIAAGSFPAIHFLRNIYLVQSIDTAIQNTNPDIGQRAIANRSLMLQGIGAGNAANEWLPAVRAAMYAVALGMIPILGLFVVTPMLSKVVIFTLGLFGWLTLWGISDAIVHQMAMDTAIGFFEQTRNSFGFGMDSIFMSPEASAKALGVFGKMRSMGIMIATVLSFGLFKFGGYAFANIAENWAQHIDRAGADAAEKTVTPEGRGQLMSQLRTSVGNHALRTEHDFMQQGQHDYRTASEGMSNTAAFIGGRGPGQSVQDAIQGKGSMSGSRDAGYLQGNRAVSAARGYDPDNKEQFMAFNRKLGNIESMMNTGNMVGANEAIEALYPGNREQGFLDIATLKAMNSNTGSQRVGDMVETIQEFGRTNGGHEFTQEQAWQNYQKIAFADQMANVRVGGDNPDDYVDLRTNMRDMDTSQFRQMFKTAKENGLNPKNIGAAMGDMMAAAKMGDYKTIEALSPEYLATGYFAKNVSQAEHGNAISEVAKNNNLTVPQMLNGIEEMGANTQFNRWLVANAQMEMFDMSMDQVTLAREGSNSTLTVTDPKKLESILDKWGNGKVLDAGAESMLRNNMEDGATFTMSFNPDSENPAHLSVKSGNETMVVDSATLNKTRNFNAGTNIAGNFVDAVLNGETSQSDFNGLVTELKEDLKDDGQLNGNTARAMVRGYDELYPIGRFSASTMDLESSSTSVSAGFKAFGTGASASTGGTTSDQETENYNTAGAMALEGFRRANDMATKDLQEMGVDPQSNPARYEKVHTEVVGQYMAELHNRITSFTNNRAIHELNDSDIGEQVNAKFEADKAVKNPLSVPEHHYRAMINEAIHKYPDSLHDADKAKDNLN